MKISQNFILREIAGEYVIVPTGEAAYEFQGLITVNETGAFLWEKLQKDEQTEESLVKVLCEEYETDQTQAEQDVAEFIQRLRQQNILANDEE